MRILRPAVAAFAVACALVMFALPATATILIEIDKSTQHMTVSQDGAVLYNWPVSTGLRRYDTPAGVFTPLSMEKTHFSREWDDAPMPNSIFFTQRGHAIHGTEHRRNIGRPASHGCVRLELENASVLFALVKREGMANTNVVLTGETPDASEAPTMVRRAPAYIPPDADDDVTGSVPQRRERVFQRVDRPGYSWGRPPVYRSRIYDERDPYERPRSPFGRVFGGY